MVDGALRSAPATVWAWRHPRAEGAAGRCIGRTDLPLDARRAKRLARRIQANARRHDLPRVVCTSPLRRGADVGRWLRRWGWTHVVDPALLEMDFGAWDGQHWDTIARADVDRWCAGFMTVAPGGGETVAALIARAARWSAPLIMSGPIVVVAHAGWMLARRWQAMHGALAPSAESWPAPPAHGALWRLPAVCSEADAA